MRVQVCDYTLAAGFVDYNTHTCPQALPSELGG